jgi:hypothetical protein
MALDPTPRAYELMERTLRTMTCAFLRKALAFVFTFLCVAGLTGAVI